MRDSSSFKAGELARRADYDSHRRAKGDVEEDDGTWFDPPTAVGPARDLPETDLRPPAFLSATEAMKDIYMRVRNRASPKTQELLEGPDLDDLLQRLFGLFESALDQDPRARLPQAMRRVATVEGSPLLRGLDDPKLTEPWRLFLDGWEIWLPQGCESGVDLFWEGESENEAGEVLCILQSLSFRDGEVNLETQVGDQTDRLTFDGEHFYRLSSERPVD